MPKLISHRQAATAPSRSWPPDSEYGIYINIPVHPSGYIASSDYTDDLVIEDILGAGSPILYRVCTTTKSYLLDAPNRYAPADITVGEMAELAKNELNSYIRRKNAPEPTTPRCLGRHKTKQP